MPRKKSPNPANKCTRLQEQAQKIVNYFRDVTFRADDQSHGLTLAAIRITGSPTPWIDSGHIWNPKARGGRGKWVKKPGPKGKTV